MILPYIEHIYFSEKHHGHGEDKEDHDNPVPHLIGVSLVLGFIFMLVVDQVRGNLELKGTVQEFIFKSSGRNKTFFYFNLGWI